MFNGCAFPTCPANRNTICNSPSLLSVTRGYIVYLAGTAALQLSRANQTFTQNFYVNFAKQRKFIAGPTQHYSILLSIGMSLGRPLRCALGRRLARRAINRACYVRPRPIARLLRASKVRARRRMDAIRLMDAPASRSGPRNTTDVCPAAWRRLRAARNRAVPTAILMIQAAAVRRPLYRDMATLPVRR